MIFLVLFVRFASEPLIARFARMPDPLIIFAIGWAAAAAGHVDEGAVGLVTLVGLVTIAASVYMITYSHQLYRWLKPFLRPRSTSGDVVRVSLTVAIAGQWKCSSWASAGSDQSCCAYLNIAGCTSLASTSTQRP